MGKMYNNIEDLLDEMITCFNEKAMFDSLEERDIISVLPVEDESVAKDFVTKTNQVLADFFDIHDELCYAEDAYADRTDNPIFFWKDYLNCFFDLELVDDDSINQKYLGTAFGMYRIVGITFIDEVNKRFKKRRLNGIRLEYKVIPTPLDRNNHWKRTYDKEF